MTLPDLVSYAGILDGLLDFAVAALIYFELRRLGKRSSAAGIALVAFFLFSGLRELSERGPLLPYSPAFDLAMTLAVAAALVALLPLARDLARGLIESRQQSEHEAREYARASRHYEQLVRHRLFNPLTVVQGAAETMKANPDLDPQQREQLLDSIIDAAGTMQRVSLHAASTNEEEGDLDAIPRVGDN